MPGYKKLRDKGVVSPSEVDRLKRARENIVKNTQKALRDKGVLSPSEVAARGYKYFPDKP